MLIDELLQDPQIRDSLAAHYRRSVPDAVSGYADSAADEDSVTGAMGHALRGSGVFVTSDGRSVRWSTRYKKLRGRGKNAPEKIYGADGVFEIELEDENGTKSRKSLPFQAKNNAPGYRDGDLRDQAHKISQFPGGGIVVNYRPEGYFAVDATSVARGEATRQAEVPLAVALSDEFLACRRGSSAYLYEPKRRGVLLLDGSVLVVRPWSVRHRIRTRLRLR